MHLNYEIPVVDRMLMSLIKGFKTSSRLCFSITGTVETIARFIILSCDRYWGAMLANVRFPICDVLCDFPRDYIFPVHHNMQLAEVHKDLVKRGDD